MKFLPAGHLPILDYIQRINFTPPKKVAFLRPVKISPLASGWIMNFDISLDVVNMVLSGPIFAHLDTQGEAKTWLPPHNLETP